MIDLQIPVHSGHSIPRIQNGENLIDEIIRQDEGRKERIIAITAHGNDGPHQAVEIMKKGIADYIPKPFPASDKTLDKAIIAMLARVEGTAAKTSEPDAAEQPAKLAPFAGGEMVFYPDRVELCGVTICSGARSIRRRDTLNLLRVRQGQGFAYYSGEELAREVGLSSGQNGAAGLIRDIRSEITEALCSQANIECHDEDVILSGGPGYRFSEKISVQDGCDTASRKDQGHGPGNRDLNVPNLAPDVLNPHVPDVPTRFVFDEVHAMSARRSERPPKYSLHRASGLAYVRDRGRFLYLGKHGSPESKEAYRRFLIDWQARRAGMPSPLPELDGSLSVVELCSKYLDYARGYYQKNGNPTRTLDQVKQAIKAVKKLHGNRPVAKFGPLCLLAIQRDLAAGGATRSYVNKLISEIKRMFKWGVSRELVPPAVQTALSTVEGLRMGRTAARESRPVLPVEDWVVEATLPHLPAVAADMVRFQRLTGCRPGEVCQLRPADVDRSAEVWEYRPESHKTQHRGRERIVYVGPQAQDVLRPYLLRDAWAACFSPAESEDKRRDEQREKRKTRVQPSQWDRRKARPKRQPRTAYTKDSYRRAVARAAEKANARRLQEAQGAGVADPAPIPHWHPNQLRHSAGTRIRRQYGLEAAQVILGHAKADITQIYAERDAKLAREIAKRSG